MELFRDLAVLLSQLRAVVVPVFRGSIFMSSKMLFLNVYVGTSLVVEELRLQAPN